MTDDELISWLNARVAEHEQAREQAVAQANAHNGAKQAYERLLKETQAKPAEPGAG